MIFEKKREKKNMKINEYFYFLKLYDYFMNFKNPYGDWKMQLRYIYNTIIMYLAYDLVDREVVVQTMTFFELSAEIPRFEKIGLMY